MNKLILACLLVLGVSGVMAQSSIPVGSWQTHNAFNKTMALTTDGEKLIAATKTAIYLYNPAANSAEEITSLTGLSDSDISAIGYNSNQTQTIVAYGNGNIDLISANKINNFRDLLLADIPGSKRINHVYSFNEFAYLSADFGLMILDLAKNQVKDTYLELGVTGTTLPVYSSTILDDSLYLATDEGIISGFLGDNLKDFNNWRRYGAADGMPVSPVRIVIESANGLLAAFDNQGVFESSNGSWEPKNLLLNKKFLVGSYGAQGNLLVTDSSVYQYNNGVLDSLNNELITAPKAALYFNAEIVVGDNNNGLVFPASSTSFYPNGPWSDGIVRLFGYLDKMVALPPAYDNSFKPLKNNAGFFIFEDGEWQNFNSTGYPGTTIIPEFLDFSDAMYSYASKQLYLSSFGYGILSFEDGEFTIYDESNSSLVNIEPTGRNVLVSALDANASVLSAINFQAPEPYNSFDFSSSSWESRPVSFPAANTRQIRGFENNTFWLQTNNGIIVFEAESQRDTLLNNGILPSSRVNDMAIDREGKMWVATDEGVVFFFNADNLLNQSFIDPVSPIYEGQILFRNEKLTALAVDGGNRIWMATTTGVWLFASDGAELIEYFNAEESPLPSNNVLDISINHQSGEVFFATEAGLVSYRGSATISAAEEPLKIFPNPVLRAQHDIVTIQGVPDNANFWVTDSSGRLVFKSVANGNTAIWSGISSNSELSSGVYFVFVSTEDGSQKQVGKIALIN